MRKELGTLETIKKLVISGDVQSGFVELKRLGLLQWSLEEAVLRYKPLFSREHVDAAGFRLSVACGLPAPHSHDAGAGSFILATCRRRRRVQLPTSR